MSTSLRGPSSSATSTGSFTAVAALGRLLGNLSWNSDDPRSDYDSFQDRFDGIVRTVEGGLEITNQCDEKLDRRRYEDTLVPLMILEDPDFDIKPLKIVIDQPARQHAPSTERPWGDEPEAATNYPISHSR